MRKPATVSIPSSIFEDENLDPICIGVLCIKHALKGDKRRESDVMSLLDPLLVRWTGEKLKALSYLNFRTGELLTGPKSIEVYLDENGKPSKAAPSKKKKGKNKRKKKRTPNLMSLARVEWNPQLAKLPYQEFLKTKYWSYIRQIKRLETENTCQHCGSHNFLQVHHTTYQYRGNEHLHLGCLKVLCETCHRKEHGLSVN